MNASDIVKAKQGGMIYSAYYKPTIFQSTMFSTVNTLSSILNYTSPSVIASTNSYVSTFQTCNTYASSSYISYELLNQVETGKYTCGTKNVSKELWSRTIPTSILAYSTIYGSTVTLTTPYPSDIRITSTVIVTGSTPVIVPLIELYNGTSYNACK